MVNGRLPAAASPQEPKPPKFRFAMGLAAGVDESMHAKSESFKF
jgi:hypothetical protein